MNQRTVAVVRGLRLGLYYFAIVFPVAFAMGVSRTLIVAPRFGELAGVMLEIPVILTLSWLSCWALIGRRQTALPQRLTMGAAALALLMAAEFALALVLPGGGPAAMARHWLTLPGALGLAGQVLFALIPLGVVYRPGGRLH